MQVVVVLRDLPCRFKALRRLVDGLRYDAGAGTADEAGMVPVPQSTPLCPGRKLAFSGDAVLVNAALTGRRQHVYH